MVSPSAVGNGIRGRDAPGIDAGRRHHVPKLRLGGRADKGFRQESWISWPGWGLRSLLAPFLLASAFASGAVMAAGFYNLAVTTLRPVRRLTQPIAATVNDAVKRIRMSPMSTTATLLFLAQLTLLALSFLTFSGLVNSLDSLIGQTEGDLMPLNPVNRADHRLYRQVFSLQLFAFMAAWATLIRTRFRPREWSGLISAIGGVGLTTLTLMLLVYPYRILWHNEHERVSYHAQTCYLLGERGSEALLFCPSEVPPRNWVIKLDDPELKRGGPTEKHLLETE